MSTIQTVLGQAWQQFRDQTVAILPHVLAGLLVFVVGIVLGLIVGRLANWLLAKSDIDRRAARLGLTTSLEAVGISSVVRIVVAAVQIVIVLIASILALYSLDARLASDLAERFFLYVPHLLVALVILTAGMFVAKFLARS